MTARKSQLGITVDLGKGEEREKQGHSDDLAEVTPSLSRLVGEFRSLFHVLGFIPEFSSSEPFFIARASQALASLSPFG